MSALTASYASPSTTHTFTTSLPTPPSTTDAAARTAALSHLQTSLRDLQSDVNTYLTARMADDKADVDAKAEDYYGEEVVDDE
jgi:hypothetical protein